MNVKCRFGHGYTWTHGYEVQGVRSHILPRLAPALRETKGELDQYQQDQGGGSEDEIIPTFDVGASRDTRVMLSKD